MIKFGPNRFKKGRLFDFIKKEDNYMEDNGDSIPRAEFESDYMNKL